MMVEDQPSVPESFDKTSQKHQAVDTRDVDSPRRYQSVNTEEEERDIQPHLWCVRCHRKKKKKCRELELGKSTRRLLERMKKQSEESEKPDDVVDEAVASVSTAPHRESISRRSAPEKSKRSRKQGAVEMADKDFTERTRRKARGRDDEEERRRRERKEERRERRERRREREEQIPRVVDAQPAAAPADILKSCCYLCAQNTLAIAAAGFKPEQSDKCIQVSAHKLHAVTPALDKSCSATLLVRTVQSSVKVKTRETSTLCPGTSARRYDTRPKTKSKKLSVFPRLTWTKCPARRHVACETDKSARRDNAEKRERPRNEKCCGEKKNAPDTH